MYVRGASFPIVSAHFGHPQKKQYEKNFTGPPPLTPFLKQPPSYSSDLTLARLPVPPAAARMKEAELIASLV